VLRSAVNTFGTKPEYAHDPTSWDNSPPAYYRFHFLPPLHFLQPLYFDRCDSQVQFVSTVTKRTPAYSRPVWRRLSALHRQLLTYTPPTTSGKARRNVASSTRSVARSLALFESLLDPLCMHRHAKSRVTANTTWSRRSATAILLSDCRTNGLVP
jgi:hypothetical protein